MMQPVSISQLLLHRRNPRRWVLEYVEKIRCPQHPKAREGSILHKRIEGFINRCNRDKHVGCVYNIDLPLNNTDIVDRWCMNNADRLQGGYSETKFQSWINPYLPQIRGVIDFYKIDGNDIHLWDFKFVNEKYAKDELIDDWQLGLYKNILVPCWHSRLFVRAEQIQFRKDAKTGLIKEIKEVPLEMEFGVLDDIEREIKNLQETRQSYQQNGLMGVPGGDKDSYILDKISPLFDCLHGRESIEDCKKRIKELLRGRAR